MLVLVAIVIVSILAVAVAARDAGAHRPGLHQAGSLEAPRLHWLVSARQETNRIARSKCRARPYRSVRPAQFVPEFARSFTIAAELVRQDAYRLLSSVCSPYPAWWERGAMCIHSHEGAWNANTGNGYYGGMQMDFSFQSSYGADMLRKYGGMAHLWSPADQLLVSWRAYRSGRGWYPWPNTARMCGLI